MNLPELRTLAIEPLDGGIAVLRVNRPDRYTVMAQWKLAVLYEYSHRRLRDRGGRHRAA
jgi:hypothetical protein